ncbi:Na+/H+ antiporter NhaC family protein [Microbacterium thalassium]|uniref:Na+/H+ antiporter NhaC n=1 Tax=Microbacterium thalassium TaxID=362649 RepID=A0A7X0FM50_9MICO|nr:Na+/H+ antiporter NhaC family protein [Microbacterium thalassium]MBB6390024.1 Na+/H+ antiporter NhaC [Microbacterium thalassium]GLK24726.1 Na+/H+ antiporter [Microbacterium thalassium]
MLEAAPWLTLIPPVVAIVLAIITKKVIPSLGAGVVAAALLIAGFAPVETLRLIWESFAVLFWDDGALNTWYIYILLFIVLLGVFAAFIMMSGGTKAFADWAVQRIRTRRGGQILPAVLGIVIFIDDYFNALAVGQISRPVTDAHRVSRAKLAYIVDSTSAPVAVLAPFSSWGAYIIGILAPIVAASTLGISTVEAFLGAAASNYYAIAAALAVWLVILFRTDLGAMRREERRAVVEGRPFAEGEVVPGQLSEDLPVHEAGAKRAVIIPFVALVLGVLVGIVWTGVTASGSWGPVDILASTDTSLALIFGGVVGLACAIYYYARYTAASPVFGWRTFGRGWLGGVKSMLPAIGILVLAWMLGGLIDQLGTGEYLGQLVESSNLAPAWLVPIVFIVAAAMAFSTGTSWGSFGLLLPIAGGIINAVDAPELLMPVFGAVLAGAVAGDHSSPISDTTILSATGAGCNVITHVITQLPMVGIAGGSALIGYIVLSATQQVWIGLVATLAVLSVCVVVARVALRPVDAEVTPDVDAPPAGGAA